MIVRFQRKIALLFFLCATVSLFAANEYTWFAQSGQGARQLSPEEGQALAVDVQFPGTVLLYKQANRLTFRHDREIFNKSALVMELCVSGEFKTPLKAWIFAKDKDGNWYQTEKEYRIEPNAWQTLTVVIDERGKNFLPVGHDGAWNAMIASGMYEFGVSLYGEDRADVKLECRSFEFTGKREVPPLKLLEWNLPEEVEKNRTFESRFQLSREYCNPFDPDEIEVNYEIELPGNTVPVTSLLSMPADFGMYSGPFKNALDKIKEMLNIPGHPGIFNLRYPAFYAQDFERSRHFTREIVSLKGLPYWAFRMIPHKSGEIRVRIHAVDRSGETPLEFYSAWRSVKVKDSDLPGVVKVSRENPLYFEFSNGSFYYPIGLNIHTNTDLRSEYMFKWGHLPDRGTYDFDDYFNAAGAGGINLIEIWMASWTYALEWDSARSYYYGIGRYNLSNAWKLDHIFKLAEQNNIYINLVLDSHGKLSVNNDQEWEDNPFNSKAAFAVANNGILENPRNFWLDFDAMDYNRKRNRYIMARWGGMAHLYAIEFWSEVNLVADGWGLGQNGYMGAWHRNAAKEVRSMDQGGHLLTTHICGDSGTVLRLRKVGIDIPEFTHIACNAYRWNVHITDQLRKHGAQLASAGKPMMIMEYGGTNVGSGDNEVRADIHGGLWAALFTQQAGTPSLWWHDFVHIKNMYPHFLAFSKFARGVDLRKDALTIKEGRVPLVPNRLAKKDLNDSDVWLNPHLLKLKRAAACYFFDFETQLGKPLPGTTVLDYFQLAIGDEEAIGWVYNRPQMYLYPADPSVSRVYSKVILPLDVSLVPGTYLISFYDTLTGDVIQANIMKHDGRSRLIPFPDFRVDIAFKIARLPLTTGERK